MSTLQALGAVAIIALLILGWALQKSRHPFDVRDALMDQSTHPPKASLNSLIIVAFAILSIWIIVDLESRGQYQVVATLLPIELGVFVTSRVAAQAIAAFKTSTDPSSKVTETVRETTVVAGASPPAEEPIAVDIKSMPAAIKAAQKK